MKRYALAGTFALLAGGVTLLLLASIFYSCRQGSRPHDMGTSANDASPSHKSRLATSRATELPPPDAAHRINLGTAPTAP
jgi:hypothetical protein